MAKSMNFYLFKFAVALLTKREELLLKEQKKCFGAAITAPRRNTKLSFARKFDYVAFDQCKFNL